MSLQPFELIYLIVRNENLLGVTIFCKWAELWSQLHPKKPSCDHISLSKTYKLQSMSNKEDTLG